MDLDEPQVDETGEIFCIHCMRDPPGQRLYLNFVSDPIEAKSIKLTPYMLRSSEATGGSLGMLSDSLALYAETEIIKEATVASLDSLYGHQVPRVYVADSGHEGDFVMNVHIFKDHSEALLKLPIDLENLMQLFIFLVMIPIHERILDALDEPDVRVSRVHMWEKSPVARMATGRLATREDICQLIFRPQNLENDEVLLKQLRSIPTSCICVGQPLMCCSCKYDDTNRSVHYNLIASDDQGASLTLSEEMQKHCKVSRVEARRLCDASNNTATSETVMEYIASCLTSVCRQNRPVVYVSKDDNKYKNKDLVINIPFYIQQAPMLSKFFIRQYKQWLYKSIATFHEYYFKKMAPQSPRPLRARKSSIINVPDIHQRFARRATSDEIYSLYFENYSQGGCFSHLFSSLGRRMARSNKSPGSYEPWDSSSDEE